jgi:protoheme ferro-lyase
MNPGLVETVAERIKAQIPHFDVKNGPIIILFSAHSLPMKVICVCFFKSKSIFLKLENF